MNLYLCFPPGYREIHVITPASNQVFVMSIITQSAPPRTPVYPESDGEPMAENTKQFEYITTVKGGLDAQFRADPNVFVAGDLFWYPVEGDSSARTAPDVMVAFGRPKGHRGSYLQWREGG